MAILTRFGRFCRARFAALDPVLLLCSTVLSLVSIVTLWGCRNVLGTKYLALQLGATAVGFLCMVVLANLDFRILASKLHPAFYFASVALLLLLLVRGTGAGGGNRNWLYFSFLPFGIQPTEFIKPALALTFAFHLTRVREKLNRPLVVLGLAAHAGSILGLIVLTGDLGVALIFAIFILLMLFCAGLSLWYFAGGAVVCVAISPLIWTRLAEYQRQRILIGFHPSLDPMGYGYQPLLSRDAIMAGGFSGEGITGGEVFRILPAAHTDFMYATICEKLGFIGGFLVLVFLLLFILRTIVIAWRANRELGSYLAIGLAGCLIVQVAENIGMCFAILPVVGITLPFISYGGSSILGVYLMAGLIHSVRAHEGEVPRRWV